MYYMGRIKAKLNTFVSDHSELIGVLADLCGIFSPIITSIIASIVAFFREGFSAKSVIIVAVVTAVVSIACNIFLFKRIRKLKTAELLRTEQVTQNMHNLSHNVRDVYFDVMHYHKKATLTEDLLARTYKTELRDILDSLCAMMTAYTGRDVSACIKLIAYNDSEDVFDKDSATLVTFSRSSNSKSNRGDYESPSTPIRLKDNTDFYNVVDEGNSKIHFYQENLPEYAAELKKMHLEYRNTNKKWEDFYRATIVVPIRIKHSKLYHLRNNNTYHILGFLCVDSMHTDAFTKQQETFNVDLMYAFADVIYILLGQYRHYLNKFNGRRA